MNSSTIPARGFAATPTTQQLRQQHKERASYSRDHQRHLAHTDTGQWLRDMDHNEARTARAAAPSIALQLQGKKNRGRGESGRATAASGDGNSTGDGDGEPPRPGGLADEAALANQLCVSKKTIQNIYSRTPHLLPPAIAIPGARGPRWTQAAIDGWLATRPQHTSKSVPVAPKRSAGRPRIALAGKRGAS
jgi:predicted DNA-binding transcriptional regulator AlpA